VILASALTLKQNLKPRKQAEHMLLFSPQTATYGPSQGAGLLQWSYLSAQGAVTYGEVDAEQLPDFVEQHPSWFTAPDRIALVLTGEEIVHLNVSVPGRSINSTRQALPFAVEEFITSDVEDVHIAYQSIRANQPVHCAVINTARLDSWLTLFSGSGITLGAVVSQAQLIRPDTNAAALLFEADQVVVVTEDQDALIDRDSVPDILDTLDVASLTCIGGSLTDLELGQLSTAPTLNIVETSPMQYLLERLSPTGGGLVSHPNLLNLLQGSYAMRYENSSLAAAWRRTLAVAAVWFLVLVVAMFLQGIWLETQKNQINAQNFKTFKELFPNDSVPVTAAQLQRRLVSKLNPSSTAGTSASMTDLMLRTTSVLGSNCELQSLRFRAKQMELTAAVLIDGFEELEAIKARSQSMGIDVEISDATAEQSRVRARLVGTYL
jgi:general secretion pathway protein L